MGITGEVRRHMFDNAVFTFGTSLANALNSVEGKDSKDVERKSQRLLNKWLGDPTATKKFKDPAKRGK